MLSSIIFMVSYNRKMLINKIESTSTDGTNIFTRSARFYDKNN